MVDALVGLVLYLVSVAVVVVVLRFFTTRNQEIFISNETMKKYINKRGEK